MRTCGRCLVMVFLAFDTELKFLRQNDGRSQFPGFTSAVKNVLSVFLTEPLKRVTGPGVQPECLREHSFVSLAYSR